MNEQRKNIPRELNEDEDLIEFVQYEDRECQDLAEKRKTSTASASEYRFQSGLRRASRAMGSQKIFRKLSSEMRHSHALTLGNVGFGFSWWSSATLSLSTAASKFFRSGLGAGEMSRTISEGSIVSASEKSLTRSAKPLEKAMTAAMKDVKVLEHIFSMLNSPDLLTCRSVCRLWESVCRIQLQEKLIFHFLNGKNSFAMISNGGTLEELTDFFVNRSFKEGIWTNSFPCNKFIFQGRNLSNKSLQEFLDIYGNSVQELSIICVPQYNDENAPPEPEQVVMEQVKRLLIHQIQNVKYLELDIRPTVSWINDPDLTRDIRSPLKNTDPEFQLLHSQDYIRNLNLNVNLEEFNFGRSTSSKIFEEIVRLAPNLSDVRMVEDNLLWLLEPINRRNLIKHLQIYGCFNDVVKKAYSAAAAFRRRNDIFTCKSQSTLSEQDKQNLEKHFEMVKWISPCEDDTVFDTINRIIRCCSLSLKSIYWNPVEVFKSFSWPSVMPRVEKLQFCSPLEVPMRGRIRRLFPSKFPIETLFPLLRIICFDISKHRKNLKILLKSWNGGQVLSVRRVQISCYCFRGKSISSKNLLSLREIFPNAHVQVEEYYELKKQDLLHRFLPFKT